MTLQQTNPDRPNPKQIAEWLFLLGRYLRSDGERLSAIEELTGCEIHSQRIEREADMVTREAAIIWQEH